MDEVEKPAVASPPQVVAAIPEATSDPNTSTDTSQDAPEDAAQSSKTTGDETAGSSAARKEASPENEPVASLAQPPAVAGPPKLTMGARFARWRETSLASQLLWLTVESLVVGSIVIAAWSFVTDAADRDAERQRTALRLLTEPGAGNRGRGEHINYLVRIGWDLNGYDLSCMALGVWRRVDKEARRESDDTEGGCLTPAVFWGLGDEGRASRSLSVWERLVHWLESPTGTREPLRIGDLTLNVDLSSAEITEANLEGQGIFWTSLRNASVSNSNFRDAVVEVSDVCRTMFSRIDFTGARMRPDRSTLIWMSNVSNALISGLRGESGPYLANRAWADAPPRQQVGWAEPPYDCLGTGRGETGSGDDGGDIDNSPNYHLPPGPISMLRDIQFCAAPTTDGTVVPLDDRPDLLDLPDEQCIPVPAEEVWESVVAAMEARTDLSPDVAAKLKFWRSLKYAPGDDNGRR